MGGGFQEFRMFDVGGQRNQRHKWIQVFEGIQAILFLISCGDFDQTLREDPNQNRFSEALRLFEGVWQNRFLSSAGLIVFLNKQDIMERKIRAGKCIGDYFPEYFDFIKCPKTGNYFNDCDRTKAYIHHKVMVKNLIRLYKEILLMMFFFIGNNKAGTKTVSIPYQRELNTRSLLPFHGGYRY